MKKLIEVVLSWGRDVVELRHLDETSTRLTVGTLIGDDLFVPLAHAPSVELLARTPHGWILRALDGGPPTLLADDVDVRFAVGPFTVRVHHVERARRHALAPVFDALWANTATITMFAMASLVALAVFLPVSLDAKEDELVVASPRFMTLMLRPPPPKPRVVGAVEPTQIALSAPKPRRAPARDRPAATAGDRSANNARPRPSDEEIVSARLAALFPDQRALGGAPSGAFVTALDGIAGLEIATAGLGVKGGSSSTSSSASAGTVAIGRIATRGRGNGEIGYGDGAGLLTGREDREVSISADLPPTVVGTLDKELVRRVVRDHMSQVRACYERGLQSDPGLMGKVTLRWTIAADGKVVQAAPEAVRGLGERADAGLIDVGDCIARAARTWRFPAPRGGGTVVVVYPFVLKSS